MKGNFYLLLLLVFTITSCKKEGIEYPKDFENSFNTWLDFKNSSGNSYKYQLATHSWTGFYTETTITVKDGSVIQRGYLAKTVQQPGNVITIHEEWVENEQELNTHVSYGTILTLDEIYERAKTELLINREDAETYFEAKNNGMISRCGFVPKNCADDCFNGFKITFIERFN